MATDSCAPQYAAAVAQAVWSPVVCEEHTMNVRQWLSLVAADATTACRYGLACSEYANWCLALANGVVTEWMVVRVGQAHLCVDAAAIA